MNSTDLLGINKLNKIEFLKSKLIYILKENLESILENMISKLKGLSATQF